MFDREKYKREWGKFFKSMIESKECVLAKEMQQYPFAKLFQGLARVRDGKVVSGPGLSGIPLKHIDESFEPACAADTGMDEKIVMITQGPDNMSKDGFAISVVPNPEGFIMTCQIPASWYFLGVYLCHKHMNKIRVALKKSWDKREAR